MKQWWVAHALLIWNSLAVLVNGWLAVSNWHSGGWLLWFVPFQVITIGFCAWMCVRHLLTD